MGERAELGWEGTAEVQLAEQIAMRMLTLVLCPDGHFSM